MAYQPGLSLGPHSRVCLTSARATEAPARPLEPRPGRIRFRLGLSQTQSPLDMSRLLPRFGSTSTRPDLSASPSARFRPGDGALDPVRAGRDAVSRAIDSRQRAASARRSGRSRRIPADPSAALVASRRAFIRRRW